MSDWFETTIGEQVLLQRGFDITKAQQRAGNVPVVSSGGVSSYHDTPAASGPGVVLGRKGTLGTVFYVPGDYWPHDTTLWVKEFRGNHPRFVYYFFKSIAENLLLMDVGTSNPTLNRNHVHPVPTLWPVRSLQERIAELLGALDDKIALNRGMNRTLEMMAGALFRSWFVDFDPVVKAEGRRAVGAPEHANMFFPSSFVDSDDASMPVGWRLGTTGGEFHVRMGQSPPGTSYNEVGDGVPFYQGCTDFGFRYPTRRLFTTAPSRFADAQDTLVSVRAPVGRVNMASERCCIGRGLAAVRHRSGSRSYTYYAMRALEERFAVFEGEGTLFGAITRDGFAALPMLVPPPEVVVAFEDYCHPIDERLAVNEREITTLAALRDTILPQLLSGTIRLRDAERAVAAAV